MRTRSSVQQSKYRLDGHRVLLKTFNLVRQSRENRFSENALQSRDRTKAKPYKADTSEGHIFEFFLAFENKCLP